jgi:hypothetical protein
MSDWLHLPRAGVNVAKHCRKLRYGNGFTEGRKRVFAPWRGGKVCAGGIARVEGGFMVRCYAALAMARRMAAMVPMMMAAAIALRISRSVAAVWRCVARIS